MPEQTSPPQAAGKSGIEKVTKTIKGEKNPAKGRTGSVDFNFGSDLNEAVAIFGPDVVHSHFKGSLRVTVQAGIGRVLEGMKEEDYPSKVPQTLRVWLEGYKPGQARPRVSQRAKVLSAIETADSEEEIEAIAAKARARLAELRAKKGQGK